MMRDPANRTIPLPRFATDGKALVYAAFWLLGLVGSMVGALVPALRGIFALDLRSGLIAQWLALVVSGFLSIPMLRLVSRFGGFGTLRLATALMAAGCMAVILAVQTGHYPVVLVALAVIAAGSTGLQVAGNPLAASLPPVERSHAHLALAQAFNGLGVWMGVNLAAWLMLGRADSPPTLTLTRGVSEAYAVATGLVFTIGIALTLGLRRMPRPDPQVSATAIGAALTSPIAWVGALAIAAYVGAEGAIAAIMVNFLHQPDILGLTPGEAGRALANIYWGGALAGRFTGSWLLRHYRATRLLGGAAVIAAGLCVVVMVSRGGLAGYAALAIGLFNAIMFPTIFSLTLERSEAPEPAVSGLLCTAIAGGALVSILVGELGDRLDLSRAFVVPLLAYAGIALFAGIGPRRIHA